MSLRRRALSVGSLVALLALAGGLAAAPVLHKRFEPDAADDVRRGARTAGGRMPAAMETESGVVRAPDEHSTSRPGDVYGAATTIGGSSYQIDRLTTQPDVVRYDDPFSPSVVPFKRLYAFDAVGAALDLVVGEPRLHRVDVGGTVAPGEDAFYGDISVDLVKDVPVRIPSVGPGSALRALQSDVKAKLEVRRDGADNWFVVSDRSTRARLLVQLSVPRAVFGGEFGAVSFASLAPHVRPLPEGVRGPADRVLSHIGVRSGASPREVLTALVAYFRSFAPSEETPTAQTTEGLYEELALSRKGVCRHRAYAFLITALRAGLPTRLVHNEAHAWVEVFDGKLWHRIDLGGAAGRLDYPKPPDVPVHRPPKDRLPWPENASPGLGLSQSGASSGSGQEPNGASPDGRGSAAQGSGATPAPTPAPVTPPPSTPQTEPPALAPSEVTLELGGRDVRRGHPLRVFGRLTSEGRPCAFSRIDLVLRGGDGRDLPLGSLATDESGRYAGEVVMPLEAPVGDETIEAKSPGSGRCGPTR